MKKMFERTFILNFDKTASIYKEEERIRCAWWSTTRWKNDDVYDGWRRNAL